LFSAAIRFDYYFHFIFAADMPFAATVIFVAAAAERCAMFLIAALLQFDADDGGSDCA